MFYLFNVVVGSEEIPDPEGSEFSCLVDAREEAKQIARDLAAKELQQGRAVDPGWRIEVVDEVGEIHDVISFRSIVMKPRHPIVHSEQAAEDVPVVTRNAGFLDHHYRVQALRQEMRTIAANIRASFQEARARLAQL